MVSGVNLELVFAFEFSTVWQMSGEQVTKMNKSLHTQVTITKIKIFYKRGLDKFSWNSQLYMKTEATDMEVMNWIPDTFMRGYFYLNEVFASFMY